MFATLLCAAVLQNPQSVTLNAAGLDRTFLVVAPTRTVKDAPLILAFHGHGGGSRQFSNQLRMEKLWPEAWVVYPQGLTGIKGITDATGSRTGWQKQKGQEEDRDLKFVDAIVEWAKEKKIYRPETAFVTGHSNGGQFVWELAAYRGEKFAAFAGLCAPGVADIANVEQKPYMVVAGKSDELVSFRTMSRFADQLLAKFGQKGEAITRSDGSVWHPSNSALVTLFYDGGHRFPQSVPPAVKNFFMHTYESAIQ